MNSTISSIRDMCLKNDAKVSEILRRCLIAAGEVSDIEFQAMVAKELNGYNEPVPKYRIIPGRLLLENDFGRMIPVSFQSEQHEGFYSKRAVGESIAALESIIETLNNGDTLQIGLPAGIKNELRKALKAHGDIVFEIQRSSLVNLIEQVKIKLLEWCNNNSGKNLGKDAFETDVPKSIFAIQTKPKIFIASSVEGIEVARNIQLELEHDAYSTIWNQSVFQLSRTALDDLIAQSKECDFAIFVFSNDDLLKMRGKTEHAIRDNVIFEFGLFMGILGKERTFAVKPRTVELHIPTDLWGITIGDFDDKRPDHNLQAALGAFCTMIRKKMHKMSAIQE